MAVNAALKKAQHRRTLAIYEALKKTNTKAAREYLETCYVREGINLESLLITHDIAPKTYEEVLEENKDV